MLSPFGYANRWTYVIDDKGVVRAVIKDVNPKTAGADLIKALNGLKV